MDQPPQSSRSSLSENPSLTQGPIPLFDIHLRYINDSYLNFFQERKKIEETYVESLRKLHRKIKSADALLDDKGDLSTIRSVWSEVVENVDREAQARQALCATLTSDVIVPLTTLKDTQERTRKRIKEDLKDSSAAYNEYAETMLPKLKSRYAKKYSEVEEQKRSTANAIPTSPPLTSSSSDHGPKPSLSNSTRPTVTAPQPLRALDRRPSTSGPTGRNRSPSSSGKKQFTQLIGFLDKGGSVKDTLAGRENQALRTVRAKREADEADKEYRKGVHWLETLRLRRTKILESGFKACSTGYSPTDALKRILEKYTDNMMATCTTQSQLSSHMRSILGKISPEKDVARLKTYIPRTLASAIPDPILYEHGTVGECNDLIFGFSLVDYATAKGLPEFTVPKIIRICIEEIDRRGLESEGIYRVSGRHAVVHKLQHEIEKDEDSFHFSLKDDIYAVASLLKLYLRELPEPVFRFSLQDRIQHTEDREEHISNKFMLLRSKIRRLPPVHQATLKALLEHLARVVGKSDKNKMDAKNVAIVFGSVIFGEDEMPKGGDLLSVQTTKDTLMEDLILNCHILYVHEPPPSSPPLPPTPAGEPVPQISYGSKSTKISTVPPPPATTTPSQDFTPPLPARPQNSIHPSSRNVVSPSSPNSPPRGRVWSGNSLNIVPSTPPADESSNYSPIDSIYESTTEGDQTSVNLQSPGDPISPTASVGQSPALPPLPSLPEQSSPVTSHVPDITK
ncbi:hypothetical protein CVT24_004278 [Panaeolus cyanescens]|uniref:Rho-GAP domain-containing protein n=1 Tax=Panaeolus cyanescens TaxID=181874 RepID=A0A409VA57_9AGAR|nr:hypothetical protein CVT24_004278 [Panaeolus cyanescens]